MKRDAVTIAIVVICIAALIYFIYGTIRLMGKETPTNTIEETTTAATEEESEDYQFDDEGDIMDDTSSIINDDLDDDQLADNYEEEDDSGTFDDEEDDLIEEDDIEEDFSNAKSGEFLVLAGAFRIKQNAENQARKIRKFDCCSDAEVSMFNRGAFATVLVDRFESRSAADKLVDLLKSSHDVEAYVHEKR